MDRGRSISRGRGAKKRATLPSYSHHTTQPLSDSPISPTTPEPSAVSHGQVQRMAHTAPQRGGKSRQATSAITPHRASSPAADQALRVTARTDRPARSKIFHFSSLSSEPLSDTGGSIMASAGSSRKRSRTFETPYDGAADDEAHSKGGHSLRKRARIDYTQEMIDDDLGLPAARAELVVKSASTPSARGRKRRGAHNGSDGESEDFASNAKRHRTDKSPAPARATSSRRRNPSKKVAPDSTSSFVDQPSDNEVQDTILVSVPNLSSDQPASQEESDRSSVNEPESPATTSDESEDDAAHPQAQPPTPVVQVTGAVKDPVSVATEGDAIGDALTISEQPEEKAQITPSHISLTPRREIEQLAPTEAAAAPEPASPQHLELPEESEARESSRQPTKTTGLSRLKQLDNIYSEETPFASKLKLTPYLDEDVALPGPYTEWVYPAEPAKEPSASISTPPPAPPLAGRREAKTEWDGRRRLKLGELFTLYRREKKRRQKMGEPEIDIFDFHNECVRRYKSVHAQDGDGASATPDSTTDSGSTVVAERPIHLATVVPEEAAQDSQQAPESRLPTAAPSPAPVEDAMDQEDAAEEEQEGEDSLDGQIKLNGPVEPMEVTRNPRKQYLFPKIRDPDDFVEAFEGWQDFSTGRLYETVAAAVETMHAYQQEYNELKKYLDDEENAKRRQANDKTIVNWENRQKADEPMPWRRHFDDAVKGPPAFEVRGARAPKPYVDDPVLEHQKEEDRIMAQAYGFKLNTHPTQVGRQNPEEQRWEMPENRLRKRTEKGAELAEENVVEGKRVRKPRYVSDQSKDVSRSGTPTGFTAFGPGRRQRRKPAASAMNGDEPESQEQVQAAESFSETPRKGRAARSRGTMLPDEQEQMTAVDEGEDIKGEDDEVEVNGKFQSSRRCGRGIIPLWEHPALAAVGSGSEAKNAKRVRGGKGEIASSSFYSNVSTAATQPDSRPSTAASDGTARTVDTTESTYAFRERRQRNYALENDPELEPRPQRRRIPASKQQESAEPKKRGPRKKQGEAPESQDAESSASAVPEQLTAQPSQQPAGTRFQNNSVGNPARHDTNNSSHPVPTQAAGPFVHTFNAAPAFPPGVPPPPPAPPAVKKPITKIRLTNNGVSAQAPSRPQTPANGTSSSSNTKSGKGRANKLSEAKSIAVASGNGDLNDKPYAEMTKSEKMSWSMRRRWASGEMQGAVEKRRSTLARKKSENAGTKTETGTKTEKTATTTGTATGTGSAVPSGASTPVSAVMPNQAGPSLVPGPGPLAPPQAPPILLRPAQRPQAHQGYLQQPTPYPYTLPHGPPGTMPPGPHGPMP
ncbi:hypothetical protein C8A03DRAFT_18800 [Achaetomium macrosporum]|uniref:Uncharacterized protein n=1 Tax=Achaetomium macrosporum TaxID=79813 RepID=A0AAN7C2X1_9PEZI|nr:hypothetical protein C8A03DRAFT_18800 [Achaetomium macrosporum]